MRGSVSRATAAPPARRSARKPKHSNGKATCTVIRFGWRWPARSSIRPPQASRLIAEGAASVGRVPRPRFLSATADPPSPSPVRDCRVWCSRAVVFWLGGEVDEAPPELTQGASPQHSPEGRAHRASPGPMTRFGSKPGPLPLGSHVRFRQLRTLRAALAWSALCRQRTLVPLIACCIRL